MAFVWDLIKSHKHYNTENLVNTRDLGTFRGGYSKALGGVCNIHFTMGTYLDFNIYHSLYQIFLFFSNLF